MEQAAVQSFNDSFIIFDGPCRHFSPVTPSLACNLDAPAFDPAAQRLHMAPDLLVVKLLSTNGTYAVVQ